jgi:hypothetical protein
MGNEFFVTDVIDIIECSATSHDGERINMVHPEKYLLQITIESTNTPTHDDINAFKAAMTSGKKVKITIIE